MSNSSNGKCVSLPSLADFIVVAIDEYVDYFGMNRHNLSVMDIEWIGDMLLDEELVPLSEHAQSIATTYASGKYSVFGNQDSNHLPF